MLRTMRMMLESGMIITAAISLLGGIAAVLVKGVKGIRQILAIIVVALVAGVWISPLVIIAAEQMMGGAFKESTGHSIVAVVSISSWNLLEALVENRVAARFFRSWGVRNE